MSPTSKRLACARCKEKKLSCSREAPSCTRCSKINAECTYSTRRPKKQSARKQGQVLSEILQRLDSLESIAKPVDETPPIASRSSSQNTPRAGQVVSSHTSVDGGKAVEASRKHYLPLHPESQLLLSADRDIALLENLVGEATRVTINFLDADTPDTPAAPHIVAPLTEALESIRDVGLLVQKSDATIQSLGIPKHVAHRWINECFDQLSEEQFIGLADRNLLLALFDVIHCQYITVDCGLRIVYYSFLYHGWTVEDNVDVLRDKDCGRVLYRECLALLPTWKEDGKTTFIDLVATVMMTWMAIEHFDYHLAFEFFEAACLIVRALRIHLLDDFSSTSVRPDLANFNDDVSKERLRRGFWQMIHTETLFRLYYDKPALLTQEAFAVNLPRALSENEVSGPDAGALSFIMNSRICFLTKDCLDVIEDTTVSDVNRSTAIGSCCDRIESYLLEWKIESLMQESQGDFYQAWTFADILINGLTSIILMNRKMKSASDDTTIHTTSPGSPSAARRIMKALLVLSKHKQQKSLSSLNQMLSFYSSVAFFTMFNDILHRSQTQTQTQTQPADDQTIHDDVDLLDQVAGLLGDLAQSYERFNTVWKAVKGLVSVSQNLLKLRLENTLHLSRICDSSLLIGDVPAAAAADLEQLQLHQQQDHPPELSDLMHYADAVETDLFGGDLHQDWWNSYQVGEDG